MTISPLSELFHRLNLRECPRAVEELLSRLVHADRVVPTLGDRQIVHALGVPAEMYRVRTVLVGLGGEVVEDCSGPDLVLLEIAVGIVDGDGPERVHRHVFHRYRVRRFAVVLLDARHDVEGGRARQAAPAGARGDEMIDRPDLFLGAEGVGGVKSEFPQFAECLARDRQLIRVPIRRLERAGSAAADFDLVLRRVGLGQVIGIAGIVECADGHVRKARADLSSRSACRFPVSLQRSSNDPDSPHASTCSDRRSPAV
jgi:hypothetical protein